jgi:hypothetical protein
MWQNINIVSLVLMSVNLPSNDLTITQALLGQLMQKLCTLINNKVWQLKCKESSKWKLGCDKHEEFATIKWQKDWNLQEVIENGG